MFYNLGGKQSVSSRKFIFDTNYNTFFNQPPDSNNKNQFFYFNTLSKIKQKYRHHHHHQIQNLFTPPNIPKKYMIVQSPKQQSKQYLYDIKKINNKMFKIHKNILTKQKRSLTPLRQQTPTLYLNIEEDQKTNLNRSKLKKLINSNSFYQANKDDNWIDHADKMKHKNLMKDKSVGNHLMKLTLG